MNQLTESYVDSLALNAAAIKNGKDLAVLADRIKAERKG